MQDAIEEVVAVLAGVPGFAGTSSRDCIVSRLGGMTNRVYHVETGEARVIVRIPGEGTAAYIDRAAELVNATAAHRAGVSARILWADAASGVMVSEAIDGIVTMTPALFASRAGAAARAGEALARLHGSGETFASRFELFAMIEEYLKILATKDVALPDGYDDVVRSAEPVRQALAAHPPPLAPAHCDPLCENFLDDGERMWIVDWEYAGMNDPLWDLGDLSVEAGMDEVAEDALVHAYVGGAPTAAQRGRVVVHKAMCDLLWTLWGLIQLADDNPAEDFHAYATERFGRCRSLMDDPRFDAHVAAVRSG